MCLQESHSLPPRGQLSINLRRFLFSMRWEDNEAFISTSLMTRLDLFVINYGNLKAFFLNFIVLTLKRCSKAFRCSLLNKDFFII
jgi:hypothetical protein